MPGTIPKGMTAIIPSLGGPTTEQDPILVGSPLHTALEPTSRLRALPFLPPPWSPSLSPHQAQDIQDSANPPIHMERLLLSLSPEGWRSYTGKSRS